MRMAEENDQAKWDEYVLSHPDSSPYHFWAWKESVEQAYGHKTFYFLAEEDNHVVGILPLVNIRVPLLINELTALPFCDVGNCLADSLQVQDDLLDKIKDFSETINCRKTSLRGSLKESGSSAGNPYIVQTGKVRMLFVLPASSEALLASFKSKLRSQIRKAEKNGVQFRWTGSDGVESFYAVYSRNMRDLGSPVHSRQWFDSIMTNYEERAQIGLTEYEGKCIGAGLILSTDSLTVIPWASTLREHNRLSPNMLLYWNFLKYSADNGFKVFDFGRSTEGEGTYRFKKQWGAQPVPLLWYSLRNNVRLQDESIPPQSNARNKVAAIWAKIPLSVANVIGPYMRKYISL